VYNNGFPVVSASKCVSGAFGLFDAGNRFPSSRPSGRALVEGLHFDDHTRKSMKERLTNFVLDIFRKRDLSKLWGDGLFLFVVA
jgi:hypothetical protein